MTANETLFSEQATEIPSATASETKSQSNDTPKAKPTTPRCASSRGIVRLNVGGSRYEVSRNTLTRYEGSMLASLISGKWKEGEGDEEIFIDRDGRRFGYILEYLRSDRVHLPHLSARSALMEEFEYFGIDADESKILVQHDFMCIDQLKKEIIVHQAAIAEKEREVAAILESYRMAKEFSEYVKTWGLNLMMQISVQKTVDREMLRECLLSRGLKVENYNVKEDGTVIAHLVSLGMSSRANK
ncbi:potassium voltage-gated channel Shal-related subfamily D member 1 [Fistulifera solaris]|uniref:Potassium voltage-gated channel Shal-related subfamily D member 1 n=1 Tax=Fistulifera solaris TaxID=1519565 RepID=A0A1Z5KHJ2_FISSO|nr:potassium voltage-gated channel Shal-related subfamily D member 1 [Fistulifera solaris]|eukprot:GAX25729.1 potassium voltage-gated channel Shal-related subfamily D member 1 [Fistulifera solaris]